MVSINHCQRHCQLNFGASYKDLETFEIANPKNYFFFTFVQVVAQEVGGARQSATAKVDMTMMMVMVVLVDCDVFMMVILLIIVLIMEMSAILIPVEEMLSIAIILGW